MFRHAAPPPPATRLSRQQADQLVTDLRALQQVEDLLARIDQDDVAVARKELGKFIVARAPSLAPLIFTRDKTYPQTLPESVALALSNKTYSTDLLERLGGAAFEGARGALTRERKAIAARLAQWVEVQA
ncbi:hypothetical protein [Pararhodobacter sp.]|uniref:hypothetical protein n=1 Tax=Pararhodobacter sp. TaxID=2127056 RepID=UPI002AFEBB4B|nr:hypothetical protein [Pararhodobacter sp.]